MNKWYCCWSLNHYFQWKLLKKLISSLKLFSIKECYIKEKIPAASSLKSSLDKLISSSGGAEGVACTFLSGEAFAGPNRSSYEGGSSGTEKNTLFTDNSNLLHFRSTRYYHYHYSHYDY